MGALVAKIKGGAQWVKLIDGISLPEFSSIDLTGSMIYNPNNQVANQWFRIESFDTNEAFNELPNVDFDMADLPSISRQQYNQIEYFAYKDGQKFFIQRVTSGSFLTRKTFCLDGQNVTLKENENTIYINPIPHVIYDDSNHCMYFMDIKKAYGIFKDLKNDYRTATESEVNDFLGLDIVCLGEDFTSEKVGLKNRTVIHKVLQQYNGLSDREKTTLGEYIRSFPDQTLKVSEDNKFIINSDNDLRLLIYGLQQRFYTAPLGGETQVATSCAKLSDLR